MARKVNIEISSDLSGDSPAQTVSFSFDGRSYEIDLTDLEKIELRDALTRYIDHSQVKVGRKQTRPVRTQVGASTATIRAWAQSQGLNVPARGRMPKDVVEKYEAANDE